MEYKYITHRQISGNKFKAAESIVDDVAGVADFAMDRLMWLLSEKCNGDDITRWQNGSDLIHYADEQDTRRECTCDVEDSSMPIHDDDCDLTFTYLDKAFEDSDSECKDREELRNITSPLYEVRTDSGQHWIVTTDVDTFGCIGYLYTVFDYETIEFVEVAEAE